MLVEPLRELARQLPRLGDVLVEDRGDEALPLPRHLQRVRVRVDVRVQEGPHFLGQLGDLRGEADQCLVAAAGVVRGLDPVRLDPLESGGQEVDHLGVDQVGDGAGHQIAATNRRPAIADPVLRQRPEPHLPQLLEGERAGAEPVVDIVVGVRQRVTEVDELRLEGRTRCGVIVLRHGALRRGAGGGGVGVLRLVAVLGDRLAHLPAQVEPRKVGVALLEFGDHPVALSVVIEAAARRHPGVELLLTGVTEGGVPQIVAERDRLHQILVQTEPPRGGPGDLCHLQRVRQTGPVVVPLVIDEHLGLVLEAAERGAVDDTVAIALERAPLRALLLRHLSASGVAGAKRVRGQQPLFPGVRIQEEARGAHERLAGVFGGDAADRPHRRLLRGHAQGVADREAPGGNGRIQGDEGRDGDPVAAGDRVEGVPLSDAVDGVRGGTGGDRETRIRRRRIHSRRRSPRQIITHQATGRYQRDQEQETHLPSCFFGPSLADIPGLSPGHKFDSPPFAASGE